MGYYSGPGAVSNGGSVVSLRSSGPDVAGPFVTYQRTTSTVTAKHGVSLAAAQASESNINLSYWTWPGGRIEPACKGTKTNSAYTPISNSNLYDLSVTSETVQFRATQGSYDSGWVS